jgi:hypothetical protein
MTMHIESAGVFWRSTHLQSHIKPFTRRSTHLQSHIKPFTKLISSQTQRARTTDYSELALAGPLVPAFRTMFRFKDTDDVTVIVICGFGTAASASCARATSVWAAAWPREVVIAGVDEDEGAEVDEVVIAGVDEDEGAEVDEELAKRSAGSRSEPVAVGEHSSSENNALCQSISSGAGLSSFSRAFPLPGLSLIAFLITFFASVLFFFSEAFFLSALSVSGMCAAAYA